MRQLFNYTYYMDIDSVFIYEVIHCVGTHLYLRWLIVYDYNFKVPYCIKLIKLTIEYIMERIF